MAKVCCHYKGTAGRRATLCINPNETCPATFGGLDLASQNRVKDGCGDCMQSGSAVFDAESGSVADIGEVGAGDGDGDSDRSDA
jgi:hypothetical protein